MNQLNSVIVEGNLVRDSVLTEPVPGFKVCKFSIAVNRFYKNHNNEGIEEVSYFDIETFGKMAEYNEKKAKKGRGVRVVGRLKQDVWKDEDNKTNSRVYVVAEHIEYKPVFHKPEETEENAENVKIEVEAETANTAPVTEKVTEPALAF